MNDTFICYLCEQEKKYKHRTVSVGNGLFTYYICKVCHKDNGYTITADHDIPTHIIKPIEVIKY